MRLLKRLVPVTLLAIAAIAAWGLVYELIVVEDVGAIGDFWAPRRLLAYAAFILAPLLTFLPIGRAMRIPLYDLEAIVAWSTLAFIVTFIDPGDRPPLAALLLFLVTLMMALATIFTLLSYAVGLRLLTRRSQRYDFVRARREGYLLAMFVVGCLLLSSLDVLTYVNAGLLGLIVLLLEVFLLSRGAAPPEPA
ncbi:MAG: hypothetical protein IRY97_05240, partial [Thermomicrobiaceae bacterium]|nr:hypothetical protein [Thermomicrobiaceae bacterium]